MEQRDPQLEDTIHPLELQLRVAVLMERIRLDSFVAPGSEHIVTHVVQLRHSHQSFVRICHSRIHGSKRPIFEFDLHGSCDQDLAKACPLCLVSFARGSFLPLSSGTRLLLHMSPFQYESRDFPVMLALTRSPAHSTRCSPCRSLHYPIKAPPRPPRTQSSQWDLQSFDMNPYLTHLKHLPLNPFLPFLAPLPSPFFKPFDFPFPPPFFVSLVALGRSVAFFPAEPESDLGVLALSTTVGSSFRRSPRERMHIHRISCLRHYRTLNLLDIRHFAIDVREPICARS